jgi:sarcosine oxidase subunit alpha
MVSQKKDCIGKHLSERPALLEKNRPILVGLKSISGKSNLSAGAHFLDIGSNPSLDNDLGHMTSTTYSPTLNCWIGLGLLKNGRERLGGTIRAVDFMRKTDVLVEICDPIFVDINGERLRG